jgi:hypothetical protein
MTFGDITGRGGDDDPYALTVPTELDITPL